MAVNLKDNQQSEILQVTIALSIVADIAIVLRLISRKLKGSYALDDILAVVGLVISWGCLGLGIYMVKIGVGKHTQLASPKDQENFFKALMAYEIVYFATLAATKLSILTFYTRLFPTRSFKIAVKVMTAVVIAWFIATTLVSIFSCKPVQAFWTHQPGSTCIVSEHFYIANAVPNIITDAIILALPIHMVWKLHTSKWERVALTFIFLLGSFVVVASIIRLSQLHQVSSTDFMWGFNNTVIWSSVEPSVAVISACLPTMRPVAEIILPRQWLSRNRSYKGSSQLRSYTHGTTEFVPKSSQVDEIDRMDRMDTENRRLNSYWTADTYSNNAVPLNAVGKSRYNSTTKGLSADSQDIHVETNINVSASSIV